MNGTVSQIPLSEPQLGRSCKCRAEMIASTAAATAPKGAPTYRLVSKIGNVAASSFRACAA